MGELRAVTFGTVGLQQGGPGRAAAPPSPLLAVPTTHPSAASVPIRVLLYDGPLLCRFNVATINGLISAVVLVLRCWPWLHDWRGVVFSGRPSVRLLPNLWTRCIEKGWTDFDANWHRTIRIQIFGSGQASRCSSRCVDVLRWSHQLSYHRPRSSNFFRRDFLRITRRVLTKPGRHIIRQISTVWQVDNNWNVKVKRQGDTTPKIVMQAWQWHRSRPLGSSSFSCI